MNMQSAKIGDLVLVDKKGRMFHAELTGHPVDSLGWAVRPIARQITWRTATSNEIKKLWRASRRGT